MKTKHLITAALVAAITIAHSQAAPPISGPSLVISGDGTIGGNVTIGGLATINSSAVTGTITAGLFSGPLTGNVTGNVSGSAGSVTGNAATATKLLTARTIAGSSFDGTGNINIDAGNLSGASLANSVIDSSLQSFGTLQLPLLFQNNAVDVGESTGNKPRTGYFGTSLFSPSFNFSTGVHWTSGTGSPEGAVTAGIGSLYSQLDGTTDTTIWRKEAGTGNTGWVADTAGGGSGTVTGPGTSTAHALASYADTTGNLLEDNAGATIASGVITATGFSGPLTGAVTGNASTATALATSRNINGVAFNGTGDITVTAAAGTLSGATLAAGVTASSLTSFGATPSFTTPHLGTPTDGTLTNCTGYTEANLSVSDITTNNASTSNHGLLKKLDNNAAHFMDGTGAWSTPVAGAGGSTTQVQLNSSGTITGVAGLTANLTSGALTQTQTSLGTTRLPGLSVINSTAAAAGAQQVSPSLLLQGQGWKTTATAASQSVGFEMWTLPVQGAAAPTGTLQIMPVIAGVDGTVAATLTSAGTLQAVNFTASASTGQYVIPSRITIAGTASGTMTVRDETNTNSTGRIRLGTDGTNEFIIQGATAGLQLRNSANTLYIGAHTNFVSINDETRIKATGTNGNLLLDNNSAGSFGLLCLGGLTTSFPAIKRNGTAINIRLADDSADTSLTATALSRVAVTGTNANGNAVTLAGGLGTGTGTGGPVIITTPLTGTTGTTAHTPTNREYIYAGEKTLTESTATVVVNVGLASSKYMGGTLEATTHADDGTDFQAVTDSFTWSAVNKAGTVSFSIQAAPSTSGMAGVTGTLTTAWTLVANGATLDFKNNAASSLSQTTLKTQYRITVNTDGTAVITP